MYYRRKESNGSLTSSFTAKRKAFSPEEGDDKNKIRMGGGGFPSFAMVVRQAHRPPNSRRAQRF